MSDRTDFKLFKAIQAISKQSGECKTIAAGTVVRASVSRGDVSITADGEEWGTDPDNFAMATTKPTTTLA